MPKDELRRDEASKWPDRFSRSEACRAIPESFRELGGKWPEVGEWSLGEGGDPVLDVDPVLGRSEPLDEKPLDAACSLRAYRYALKMSGWNVVGSTDC